MNQSEIAALKELLYGSWGSYRKEVRRALEAPLYRRVHGLSLKDHRARVMKQLKKLSKESFVSAGFPSYLGGKGLPGAGVAVFEELVLSDPSLQIKYGVHYGLFASAILNLGTEEQHRMFLPDAINLKIPGVFAMTETGHGSDVSSLRTIANYDVETQEFIIHTPDRQAWKDYLGNAAQHGRAAVVFAQLIVNGESHGVHAFYVPIRDSWGRFLHGVNGEDDGAKGGLNGIDNGRLHFSNVRVPRINLLAKYGSVSEEGEYSSPIESKGRRFFTMLSTLVQGRVSLVGAVTNAQKLALAVAVPYAYSRTQFADSNNEERRLIDYPLHRSRLIPSIAETYAQSFIHQELLEKFHLIFSGELDSEDARMDLETFAAAAKAYSTWAALRNIQQAREACGGQGYLAENQIVTLHADLDVYATFEGDNHVLLQLVAKRLLDDLAQDWKKPGAGKIVEYAFGKVERHAVNRAGLRKVWQEFSDHGSKERSLEHFLDKDSVQHLLAYRVHVLIQELAEDLRKSSNKGASFIEHQEKAVAAAYAHAELITWEAFRHAVEDNLHLPEPVLASLNKLLDVYGIELIEKHAAWHLMEGTVSNGRMTAVSEQKQSLFASLEPEILGLVEAFDVGELVSAPIVR